MQNKSGTISAREFALLSPYLRGRIVAICGGRKDQPNIPNEGNPYPIGSDEWKDWNLGAVQGIARMSQAGG